MPATSHSLSSRRNAARFASLLGIACAAIVGAIGPAAFALGTALGALIR